MKLSSFERRQFLKRLSQALGTVTAASILTPAGISAAMAYSPRTDSAEKAGKVFSKDQMLLLRDMVETILPTTDTPGAAELDCHGFVDHQLAHVYSPQHQDAAKQFLNHFEDHCLAKVGESFTKMKTDRRTDVLNDLEQAKGFSVVDKESFKQLKNLVVFGYFTSEEGASKILNYQAFPGGFKGSVPCTSETKSWGSLPWY